MSETETMDDHRKDPRRKYSLTDFIQAVKVEGGEATTPEIRDEVGCGHETARRRMKELEDDGIAEGRKIGSTLVWTLV
ncbi:ArsR family transcriptional regulator [Halococcus thailandensis]|nr:ArsR family transcriptional regulator [Halococcus thailandensis]